MHKENVLISGGSSGIGLALAKLFTQKGANVSILARRMDQLAYAKDQIQKFVINDHQQIKTYSADVSDFSQLTSVLNNGQRESISILMNSAGVAHPGEFTNMNPEIFAHLMQVNYLGTVYLTKLILPEMIANKKGYIINIASLAALVGIYGYTAYAPTKYAVRGFSRCLRAEVKAKNIDVSVVFPPDTTTPQLEFEKEHLPAITRQINAQGGEMDPDDVARSIIKGISKKRFTIVPGIEGKLLYAFAPIVGRYLYNFAVKRSIVK